MPVLVKNCEPGPTVFSDAANDVFVQWEGDGDPEGRDVQEVSDAIMKHPNFARAVRNGVFQLLNVDDDEATRLLAPAAAQAAAQRKAESDAIDATLEASNIDNDIVEVKCLVSEETLYLTNAQIKEAPPLAPRFAEQADDFMRVEVPGMVTSKGEPQYAWVRKPQA